MNERQSRAQVLAKPELIGEFGNDYRENTVSIGRPYLRYFYEPVLRQFDARFDLNRGFEHFESKPIVEYKLDSFLRYLMEIAPPSSSLQNALHGASFVSWRGTLSRIAAIPYSDEKSDPLTIVCMKFNNVIFLCELLCELKLQKQDQETEREKRMSFWGFSFERYVSTKSPGGKPDIDAVVSTYQDHCALFKVQIGEQMGEKITVAIGAEMDACDRNNNFVEFKTHLRALGQGRYWDNKAMRTWLQSHLVGIERLIFGLRDYDGTITRIQETKTHHLEQRRNGWEPNVCMRFLLDSLLMIQNKLAEVPEGTLILFEIKPPEKTFRVRKIDESQRSQYEFLTLEFKRHFSTY